VLFWCITVTRYLLAALAALFLSVVISFFTIQFFIPADENPVIGGLFWLYALLAEGTLLVPLSLAITAELVEYKVQARRYSWPKACRRFLVAIPMAIGPVYAVFVVMTVEDRRPAHWFQMGVLVNCVSEVFAYLALRIRKQPMQPATDEAECR
jgi:MFS family permease